MNASPRPLEPPLSPGTSFPSSPPPAAPPAASYAPEPEPAFVPEPESAPLPLAEVPPTPLALQPDPQPPSAVAAPPAPRAQHAVVVRLTTGELIEVAAHGDPGAAAAEATALMRYLRDGRGDWPFIAGRFVRPDAIVSIDLSS